MGILAPIVVGTGMILSTLHADAQDLAAAEALYAGTCRNCHGPAAQGMASFPKLAGQTEDHLVTRLGQYRQRRWAVGAALLLVAMLAGGAILARRDAPPVVPAGAIVGGPSIAVYPHGRDRPPPTSPGAPLAAVVTVTRDCWVLAVVDGSTVVQETVPAGETVRIDATRTLDLRFGDAGAANLRVNGRRFPTGASGEVADLSFALRGDRLVASA